jgi:hypothetical protein
MTEKSDGGETNASDELVAWITDVCRLIPASWNPLAADEMPLHDPAKGLAYRERPLDRGTILQLITDLVVLEHTNHPRHGSSPPIWKDELARSALTKAGILLGHAIRWSIMHHVGLAVSKTPASVFPRSDIQSPAYIPGLERAGTHAHEIAGASWPETDPAAARSALASVIELVLGFWGPAHELAEALRALELGEVQPILSPGGKGKHGSAFTLQSIRLAALAFVEFGKGFGTKEEDARHEVADALGVSPDTLSTWRKRLPVNEPQHRATLDSARVAGKDLRWLSRLPQLGPENEQRQSAILEAFGPKALGELALAYARTVAEGAKKSRFKTAAS